MPNNKQASSFFSRIIINVAIRCAFNFADGYGFDVEELRGVVGLFSFRFSFVHASNIVDSLDLIMQSWKPW